MFFYYNRHSDPCQFLSRLPLPVFQPPVFPAPFYRLFTPRRWRVLHLLRKIEPSEPDGGARRGSDLSPTFPPEAPAGIRRAAPERPISPRSFASFSSQLPARSWPCRRERAARLSPSTQNRGVLHALFLHVSPLGRHSRCSAHRPASGRMVSALTSGPCPAEISSELEVCRIRSQAY